MQARKVSLSTGELTYFVAGEGRPLLYLHPAGGVRWTQVLEGLAESFALHVPVMPGFDGTSAHGSASSMQGLAKLMGDFIHKVTAVPTNARGDSVGGVMPLSLSARPAHTAPPPRLRSPA